MIGGIDDIPTICDFNIPRTDNGLRLSSSKPMDLQLEKHMSRRERPTLCGSRFSRYSWKMWSRVENGDQISNSSRLPVFLSTTHLSAGNPRKCNPLGTEPTYLIFKILSLWIAHYNCVPFQNYENLTLHCRSMKLRVHFWSSLMTINETVWRLGGSVIKSFSRRKEWCRVFTRSHPTQISIPAIYFNTSFEYWLNLVIYISA